ncbi:MAG: Right handed beta helix region [Candidatus Argoarchaeum ethanivorans]|uniref:Right handed beta helix region n=1 Tax=Candidatus Argoarchaeum ethanivorans TaxID=2608793 RepID=A0A811ZZD5_9EURY|nr:MAG: Right handed beta helix region [Candidatus Argoarchaeum ethanivorans]
MTDKNHLLLGKMVAKIGYYSQTDEKMYYTDIDVSNKRVPLKILYAVFILILLSGQIVYAAGHYIRPPGGSYGNEDGTDWNNAYDGIPSTLIRGDTYYLADGSYGKYTFDDPESGSTYITIKKAIGSDHGTNIGWNSAYGDGTAQFNGEGVGAFSSIVRFSSGYYKFDGQTGGGPGSWGTGHGFTLSNSTNVLFIYLGKNSETVEHVEIRHVAIGSPSAPVAGIGTAIYIPPAVQVQSYITISHCYIHDIGDSMTPIYDANNITFEYNYITRNATSPKSHGAGMELNNATDITIRYNLYEDITGSGWIGFYGGVINNVLIYGNIFRTTPSYTPPEAYNGVVYNTSGADDTQSNIKVHNNTFYNLKVAQVLLNSKTQNGHEAYNNIMYNVTGTIGILGYAHDYNMSDEDLGEINNQITSSDPFIDSINGDFNLIRPTEPGIELGSSYDKDMVGRVFSNDGIWDRGALEASPLPPTNLRIIVP